MKDNRGYTLIEVMVVAGIIGILAAIATPDFLAWYNNEEVRSAASNISTSWLQCRQKAVTDSLEYRLTVDDSALTVLLEKGDSFSNSANWAEDAPASTFANLGQTVTFSPETDDTGSFPSDGIVICRPDGTVVDSAGNLLANNSFIQVGNDLRSFKITVTSSRAGRIKVEGPISSNDEA